MPDNLNGDSTEDVEALSEDGSLQPEGAPSEVEEDADGADGALSLEEQLEAAQEDNASHDATEQDEAEAESDSLTTESNEDNETLAKLQAELDELRSEQGRWKSTRQAHDQLAHELKQIKGQIGDADLEEVVSTYKQVQERKDPWDVESKDYASFQKTLQKHDVYRSQMASADPDQRETLAQMWQSSFTEDELKSLRAYESHKERYQQEMLSNPRFFDEQVNRAVEQKIRQYSEEQALSQRASSLINDDENWAVIQPRLDEWKKYMQAGYDPEFVFSQFKRDSELESLRSQIVKAETTVASAEAQKQLSKGRASQASVDIEPSQEVDVYQLTLSQAKEMSITEGGDAFMRLLSKNQDKYGV